MPIAVDPYTKCDLLATIKRNHGNHNEATKDRLLYLDGSLAKLESRHSSDLTCARTQHRASDYYDSLAEKPKDGVQHGHHRGKL